MKGKFTYIISVCVLLIITWVVVLNESLSRPVNYNKFLSGAKEQEELQVYKKAVTDYKSALKIYNKDINVHLQMAEALKKANLKSEYLAKCDEIISLFPDDERGYVLKVNYFVEENDFRNVISVLKTAKEKFASSEQINTLYKKYAYKFEFLMDEYDEVRSFSNGFSAVKIGDKWGYIQESGNLSIKPVFDYADSFGTNKIAAVQKGNELYYIDGMGERALATKEKFETISSFSEGLAKVSQDSKFGYIKEDFVKGNLLWEKASNYINGVAAVSKDGKWALRDTKGKLLTDIKYEDIKLSEKDLCFNNSVAFAKQDGKYIMLNKKGKQVVNTAFDDAKAFESSQYAAVKVGDKWGFIDAKGKIVIKPNYDAAESFSIGLAAVKIGDKWGYIDLKGETVIEPQFISAKMFSQNGIAAVQTDNKWRFIQLYSYRK